MLNFGADVLYKDPDMLEHMMNVVLHEDKLEAVFVTMLWAGPLVGLVCGVICGFFRKSIRRHAFTGLGFGSIFSLVSVLWYMFNAVMRIYGLDSVKGLLVNIVMFLLIGALAGVVFRAFRARRGTGEHL